VSMDGLGMRLRELRKRAGLSQEKLALECIPPLEPAVIYRIEAAIIRNPSTDTLVRIVQVLRRNKVKATSDFLLGISPEKSSKSSTAVR